MKFCPIIKDECRDDCAFSVAVDYQVNDMGERHDFWCAITHVEMALADISQKLPNMNDRENFDLFVQAHVLGAIDTYEQN